MKKDAIQSIFEELTDMMCWGVGDDPQLNLSLSFGEPVLRVREPFRSEEDSAEARERHSYRLVTVKGAWWLWVFMAYWQITLRGARTASTSSPLRQKQEAFARLSGQKLVTATVRPKTGATVLEFDLGGCLAIRRFERTSKDSLWDLYRPDGYVLAVRGDGEYSYQPGSTPGKDIRWQHIKKTR